MVSLFSMGFLNVQLSLCTSIGGLLSDPFQLFHGPSSSVLIVPSPYEIIPPPLGFLFFPASG